jgi:hypothetical protein
MGECEKKLFWALKMAAAYGCMPAFFQHWLRIISMFESKKQLLKHRHCRLIKIIPFYDRVNGRLVIVVVVAK